LNNYQQHQQEAKRCDQILASLERTLGEGIESGRVNAAQEERQAAEFQRALQAGEMPPLYPFVFTTDYSPGDFSSLLQSGEIELLDVETLTALRNDEPVIRWGLSRIARYLLPRGAELAGGSTCFESCRIVTRKGTGVVGLEHDAELER
jgi:hypothetical protein